jgi:hypothetical protein
VWRTTPVALITDDRPFAANDERPIAFARITSSLGTGRPLSVAARTSSSVRVNVRFTTARPNNSLARRAGSDRSSVSTDGMRRRGSEPLVVGATFARRRSLTS